MAMRGRSDIVAIALGAGAVAAGALGLGGLAGPAGGLLVFAAWIMALVALFLLALRVPLRGRGRRLGAWGPNLAVTVAAIAVVVVANVALYRHDVHFDVSREERNTPPEPFTRLVENLKAPLALTYFFNQGDANALRAVDLMTVAARSHPLFEFKAVDVDKEPGLARDAGVRAYNTAVLRSGDRQVKAENTTDLARISYAALRALNERSETVCLTTGHGEPFRPGEHVHFGHVETLAGHDTPGAGDVLEAKPANLDRLIFALSEIGYAARGIVTATEPAIPADCTVVAIVGPRTALDAHEVDMLRAYLAGGGRLLLLLDPVSQLGPDLTGRLLGAVSLAAPKVVVIDPLNHFRTDPDKVAVPYYPQHPITERLALTVFPQSRPIDIGTVPPGVAINVLASSSGDSYRRPYEVVAASAAGAPPIGATGEPAAQALAVAASGTWPGAEDGKPFRLVLAGTSKFATNEYFSYASNGELAVDMLRWLAADQTMPSMPPKTYSLPEIVLTAQQMRAIFIVLEVLLPLLALLCGVVVWWRRR